MHYWLRLSRHRSTCNSFWLQRADSGLCQASNEGFASTCIIVIIYIYKTLTDNLKYFTTGKKVGRERPLVLRQILFVSINKKLMKMVNANGCDETGKRDGYLQRLFVIPTQETSRKYLVWTLLMLKITGTLGNMRSRRWRIWNPKDWE